jgi:hypothetical protein
VAGGAVLNFALENGTAQKIFFTGSEYFLQKIPVSDLIDEIGQRLWIKHSAEQKTEQCTVQMSIMVDVIVRFLSLVVTESNVERPKDESRHAKSDVNADVRERFENDECKDDRAYPARRAE